MIKYYIKRDGKKVGVVPNTLDAIKNKAQQEADRIGRAVMVYSEEVGGRGKAAAKVYARNPAKKGKAAHKKRVASLQAKQSAAQDAVFNTEPTGRVPFQTVFNGAPKAIQNKYRAAVEALQDAEREAVSDGAAYWNGRGGINWY